MSACSGPDLFAKDLLKRSKTTGWVTHAAENAWHENAQPHQQSKVLLVDVVSEFFAAAATVDLDGQARLVHGVFRRREYIRPSRNSRIYVAWPLLTVPMGGQPVS